jgi:Uma2 family endonuclease
MTYDQYRLMPEDGKRYELIDGELMMTPAPSPKHQRILRKLALALVSHVESNALGEVFFSPVDVVLEEHVVVQPDILFVRLSQHGIVGDEAIHGAPELVVEILSPTSFYHDLRRKLRIYSQYGVQEYWVVDPEKETIEIYARNGQELQLNRQFAGHEALESTFFPGFRLPVNSIF